MHNFLCLVDYHHLTAQTDILVTTDSMKHVIAPTMQ